MKEVSKEVSKDLQNRDQRLFMLYKAHTITRVRCVRLRTLFVGLLMLQSGFGSHEIRVCA